MFIKIIIEYGSTSIYTVECGAFIFCWKGTCIHVVFHNSYINIRENRRNHQKCTIQLHWKHWEHKTQNEDKQNKHAQLRKLKRKATRTLPQKPSVNTDVQQVSTIPASNKTPAMILI